MNAIDAFNQDAWTRQDVRPPSDLSKLTPGCHRDHAFGPDCARCQALVEIDVLTAEAAGSMLDGLQTIHRVQLPVMRQYEAETDYGNGCIVLTPSKGLPRVGLPRKVVKRCKHYTLTTCRGANKGMPLGWADIEQLASDPRRPYGVTQRAGKACIAWGTKRRDRGNI